MYSRIVVRIKLSLFAGPYLSGDETCHAFWTQSGKSGKVRKFECVILLEEVRCVCVVLKVEDIPQCPFL